MIKDSWNGNVMDAFGNNECGEDNQKGGSGEQNVMCVEKSD